MDSDDKDGGATCYGYLKRAFLQVHLIQRTDN